MSATEPNPRFDAAKSDWKGDPYAASSLAESSGGTKPSTTYVSRAGASDGQKVDPTVNRPGYGGESPATNAPAQQPLGQ